MIHKHNINAGSIMTNAEIPPEIWQQIQQRAAQANTTVENLLLQWVSAAAPLTDLSTTIIEQLSDAVIITNPNLQISSWNKAAETIYGWTAAEAMGQSIDALVKTEWASETQAQAQATLVQSGRWQGEITQSTRSGQKRVILASVSWLRDENGNIIGGITINRDITQRKEAEEALRQSESRLKSLLESQTAYICRTDLMGYFTYANQRFLEKTGYKDIEFLNMHSLDTVIPEDHQKVRDTVRDCLKMPNQPVQIIVRKPTKSGEAYTSLWEFTALTDETGRPTEVLCIGFDITAQVTAQTALRQSEDRYRQIVETAREGIWLLDAAARTTYVNRHMAEMLGYTPLEMQGRRLLEFMTPENHSLANYYLERRQQGIIEEHEFCFEHRSGQAVWVTIATNPLINEAGQYEGTLGMLTDITARKQADALKLEQERLKAILQREQEWNVLIHRAIAALDHDIRNPLSVIATSKNILENYSDRIDAEKRQERLDAIGRQLDYVMQLIHDLTAMLRGNLSQRQLHPQKINLEVLCQIIVKEMQATLGVNHRFAFINRALSAQMMVDEVLVSRILLNLLSNAVKYSSANSLVQLELATRESKIVLRVIDEGIGIRPEDQAKIFEVFYRAADVSAVEGKGLGLNIVLDCVQRHQGIIRVESEIGKGATFIVELPQEYA
jgi:hypothetical protein